MAGQFPNIDGVQMMKTPKIEGGKKSGSELGDYIQERSPSLSLSQSARSCYHCGKNFKRSSYLKAHLRRHEEWDAEAARTQQENAAATASGILPDEGAMDHPCRLCGRRFETRHSLVLHHARRHTPRPYRCVDCGRRFINAPNLRIHRRIHSGERLQYECVCGKSFAWKTALMSHRKRCQHLNGAVVQECVTEHMASMNSLRKHSHAHQQVVEVVQQVAHPITPQQLTTPLPIVTTGSTLNTESIQQPAETVTSTWLQDTPNGPQDIIPTEAKPITDVFWGGNFEVEQSNSAGE